MEALKLNNPDLKFLTFETECKQSKNDIFIEGFANRFAMDGKLLVDRGNDLIPPEAFNLDEFKALPIIFFNHDRDMPIGKAVNLQVKEDGLYVKAKLSSSAHPEIERVRTLVKEGILKAFSVGFDPIKVDQEEVEGKQVNVIKEANLLEISVVSLPMAQHSLFSVSSKSLSQMPIATARNILKHPEWFAKQLATPDTKQGIPSQPIEAELSNPVLDLMKQSNVLLASLIREMQLMSEKFDLLQAPAPAVTDQEPEEMPDEERPPEETEPPPPPPEDDEEEEGEENRLDDEDKDEKPMHDDDHDKETCEDCGGEKLQKKLTIIDRYSDICNKILSNAGH